MAIKRLLAKKRSPTELRVVAGRLVEAYKGDQTILYILADLEKRAPLLFGYMRFARTPTTTNLIECFNSHLEGRLKTIKGFQAFRSADTWLNAYFLKRRLTPFKDCGHPFKRLNGHCSLEKTLSNIDNLEKLRAEIMHPFWNGAKENHPSGDRFPTKKEIRNDRFWNTSEWFWTIIITGVLGYALAYADYKGYIDNGIEFVKNVVNP